jgi:hypothetical protein
LRLINYLESVDHASIFASESDKLTDLRLHPHLRDFFEEAYLIALPFLDPKLGWGGQPMTRHAYPALQEAFPDFDMQDISILVPALTRVFHERNR